LQAMTYSQREFDRHMTLVPKLFNVQSTTEEGGGAPVQKDMFGTITTPRPLPDDRDEEWEKRKRGSMVGLARSLELAQSGLSPAHADVGYPVNIFLAFEDAWTSTSKAPP
jgi:hypothetical protein